MTYNPVLSTTRRSAAWCVLCLLPTWFGGCAAPKRILPLAADRYRIDVELDTESHRLVGHAAMDLRLATGEESAQDGPCTVELVLHPDLRINDVHVSGASGRYLGTRYRRRGDGPKAPRVHLIRLEKPVARLSLSVDYEGALFQDVSAGEVAGAIHNLSMRAHIGEDGIYLAGGPWYPTPGGTADSDPTLSDFVLVTHPVTGMVLAAGAERDQRDGDVGDSITWRSPYPIEDLVLVGGPHEVHEAEHNGVAIRLHLKPSQAEYASGLIEAVRRYLDRYTPLFGPYPAGEFKIVDNFFSSGFAFPTFTLLNSMVINMGERSQTAHGYIDHEMLHCWWGNGVHVDPRDGNWCEALASYGANYYGHVLDGNEDEARRKRRNYCHFLSRMKPEDDRPLGTYGQPDGCGRGIAYKKGAMVFHMLAEKIGRENFFAALRRMTDEYTGRFASWDVIRRLCEETGDISLDAFFQQWVRSSGAPRLSIDTARYDTETRTLLVELRQEGTDFELDVPVRIYMDGSTKDVVIPLRSGSLTDGETTLRSIPLSHAPSGVEMDPDYNLFRQVEADDIIPTTATTRRGEAFACVMPAGTPHESYESIASYFRSSFEEEERLAVTAGSVKRGVLNERSVLILGAAVDDAYVDAYLGALSFPVRFQEEGFVFEGVTYSDPSDAVLCTIRHPDVTGGVTVVYANSDDAIPSPMGVPMYDRSLVIFKNKKPVLRRDFERRRMVSVMRD